MTSDDVPDCWIIILIDSIQTWQGLALEWSAGAVRSPHLQHRTDGAGLEPFPHPPSASPPAYPDPVLAGGLTPAPTVAQHMSHPMPGMEMLAERGLDFNSDFISVESWGRELHCCCRAPQGMSHVAFIKDSIRVPSFLPEPL